MHLQYCIAFLGRRSSVLATSMFTSGRCLILYHVFHINKHHASLSSILNFSQHLAEDLLHLLGRAAPARLPLERLPAPDLPAQFVERLLNVRAAVAGGSLEERARALHGKVLALGRRHLPLVLQVGLVADQDAGDVARLADLVKAVLDVLGVQEARPVCDGVDNEEAVTPPRMSFRRVLILSL